MEACLLYRLFTETARLLSLTDRNDLLGEDLTAIASGTLPPLYQRLYPVSETCTSGSCQGVESQSTIWVT